MAFDLRAPKKVRPGVAARDVLAEQPYDLRAPKAVKPGVKARDALIPTSGSSQAPTAQAAAAKAALAASGVPTSADLISGYNLARAKILQGMAPQVQDIYSRANSDLRSTVGGLTEDLRSRLYDAGGGKQAFFDHVDPRIQASYESGPASQAAYNLGAAIPGESLAKQGAAFGAAATFAPERALQEGQYALQEAIQKEKVTNADAAKVSAATSKMLGFVADAYGNPILGKNGKPIKLPDAGLTPYQKASLGLSAARLDSSNAATAARIDQSAKNAAATDARFYNGLQFRSSQQAQIARQKADTTDWNASGKAGVLIAKDGTVIHDAHGRTIKFTTPSAARAAAKAKTRSVTQSAALDKAVKTMFEGTSKPVKKADGTYESLQLTPGISYQVALRRLQKTFKLNLKQAQDALDTYYTLPDVNSLVGLSATEVRKATKGRPLISFQDRKALIKAGYPRGLVENGGLYDIQAYARLVALQQKRQKKAA